jgi:hypothetical protein
LDWIFAQFFGSEFQIFFSWLAEIGKHLLLDVVQKTIFSQDIITHGKSWEKITSFILSNKSTFLA